jgi:hypothetical protein
MHSFSLTTAESTAPMYPVKVKQTTTDAFGKLLPWVIFFTKQNQFFDEGPKNQSIFEMLSFSFLTMCV